MYGDTVVDRGTDDVRLPSCVEGHSRLSTRLRPQPRRRNQIRLPIVGTTAFPLPCKHVWYSQLYIQLVCCKKCTYMYRKVVQVVSSLWHSYRWRLADHHAPLHPAYHC